MEYQTLGRTDLEVSALGIGGATFGREIDGPEAWSLLDRALERGITLVDTAEAYSSRESERMIGPVALGTEGPPEDRPGHQMRVHGSPEWQGCIPQD